jgi:RHS repeat-associated protein
VTGEQTLNGAAVDQLFYYTGQERDAATGLQYHSDGSPTGRWYDPRTGRWLSEDPVNAPNLYPYADNDPINKVDPTGRTPDFNPLTKLPGASKPLANVNLAGGLSTFNDFNQQAIAKDAAFGIAAFNSQQLSKTANLYAGADLGSRINDPFLTNPRVQAGFTIAQGFGETSVATGLALFPEPTLPTKVGAGALYAKSFDSLQAGARGLYYGQSISTLTQSTVQSTAEYVGIPRAEAGFIAGVVDVAPGIVGGYGLAVARNAGRTSVTSFDEVVSNQPQNLSTGNLFNRLRANKFDFNEIYVENPAGGKYRLDSYNPASGEIVSRKGTQFANVEVRTGVEYVREAARKYSPGTKIANVPTSGSLAGQELRGSLYLEVPIQVNPIPKKVLDAAAKSRVIIRDVSGREY